VLGATGAQGSDLIHAMLMDERRGVRARAIRRYPDSEHTRTLATQRVECAFASLFDGGALATAFAEAHGVFQVTDFRKLLPPETWSRQAWNIARAAHGAGVKHELRLTLGVVLQFSQWLDCFRPQVARRSPVHEGIVA
jgi:uncharacterized protein YbjT (DUF2867 family)